MMMMMMMMTRCGSADGVRRSTRSLAVTASTIWADTSWVRDARHHAGLATSSASSHRDTASCPKSSTPDFTGLAGFIRRPTRAGVERRGPSPRQVSACWSLPPPRMLCFHLCLSVCLSVNRATRKLLIKIKCLWNFMQWFDIIRGPIDLILVRIWIRMRDFLKEFYHALKAALREFGSSPKMRKPADLDLNKIKGCLDGSLRHASASILVKLLFGIIQWFNTVVWMTEGTGRTSGL